MPLHMIAKVLFVWLGHWRPKGFLPLGCLFLFPSGNIKAYTLGFSESYKTIQQDMTRKKIFAIIICYVRN